MANDQKIVVRTEGGAWFGPVWVIGWLFALGYLHLQWPKALYAVLLWPYYLGLSLARPVI